VSWYKFDRSHEFIPVYKAGGAHWRSVAPKALIERSERQGYKKLHCVQMRVSGCRYHYKAILCAGAKAKSVTNNLPILSVLGAGVF